MSLDFFELSTCVWFPVGAVLFLTAEFVLLYGKSWGLRGFLLAGILYFLFRVWIECEVIKEFAPWDVPIRVDLLLFAPMDFIMTGIYITIVISKPLAHIMRKRKDGKVFLNIR